MAENGTEAVKARLWSGYVCPDCRFVFRIPRDHDGEGVVCPSCRRMLRLPKEGEETAPLMAPLQKVKFAEEEPETRGEKRRRAKRKKVKAKAEVPDWDPVAGKWMTTGAGRRSVLEAVGVWLAAASALAVAAYLFDKAGERDDSRSAKAAQEVREQPDNPVAVPLMPPEENPRGQVEKPAQGE